jgi:hypothetical protein
VAAGRDVVVIANGATTTGAGLIVMFKGVMALTAGDDESVTTAANPKLPAAVGVPLIAPVLGFKIRPEGRLPDAIVQL